MKCFFAFLSVVIIISSCSKKVDPCRYDACAVAAPASEIAQLEAYLTSAAITTATKHCSGMYYIIDAGGSGATANICNTVAVKYKGQLTNGSVFDQATSPVTFRLDGLIEAWKKGIPLIKPGGKIKLYCPPSLAYGSQAVGTIPANSILIFEVELTNVY